jgi:hypothetical protein
MASESGAHGGVSGELRRKDICPGDVSAIQYDVLRKRRGRSLKKGGSFREEGGTRRKPPAFYTNTRGIPLFPLPNPVRSLVPGVEPVESVGDGRYFFVDIYENVVLYGAGINKINIIISIIYIYKQGSLRRSREEESRPAPMGHRASRNRCIW